MTPDQRIARLAAILVEERHIEDPDELIPGARATRRSEVEQVAREMLTSPHYEVMRALARLIVEEVLADTREMLASTKYDGTRALARLMAEEAPAATRPS